MKGEGLPVVVETPKCLYCGKSQLMTVDRKGFEDWTKRGMSIQMALPTLSKEDRELLISGTCPECWDELFYEDEHEEE